MRVFQTQILNAVSLSGSLSSSGDSGTVSESVSGKSSPASFPDPAESVDHTTTQQDVEELHNKTNLEKTSQSLFNDSFGPVLNSTEITTNGHTSLTNVIDTTARFSKLGLFDDNNSFFSTNTFPPSYFKLDQQQNAHLRNADSNSQTNSPQLPDLLSGTESDKERQELQEKLSLLSSLQNAFSSGGKASRRDLFADNTLTILFSLAPKALMSSRSVAV